MTITGIVPGQDQKKCEVCGQERPLVVAAMPGVPVSVAYCRACLDANAHPWHLVVANTALIGGLDEAADWWKELVDATIKHLRRPRSKFDDDVAAEMAEMDAELRYEGEYPELPDGVR